MPHSLATRHGKRIGRHGELKLITEGKDIVSLALTMLLETIRLLYFVLSNFREGMPISHFYALVAVNEVVPRLVKILRPDIFFTSFKPVFNHWVELLDVDSWCSSPQEAC